MNKTMFFKTLAITGLSIIFCSCTDDSFKEIESDLLGNPNYDTGVYTATVSINNVKEKATQANGLGGYLLGQYTQEPFGTKKASIIAQVTLPSENPTFGANSQATEIKNKSQEEETVTEVYLYIPFFNPNSFSKNFSYTKDAEYVLDSIYGDSKASFQVDVKELTYFLRDIDENLKNQVYYSDLNVNNHLGVSLIKENKSYTISRKAIIRNKLGNSNDKETDNVGDVLAPGIRIDLKPDFFQQKILNKEGSNELSNQNVFKNYFRGIAISVDNLSADLMMLLNMANAKIELVYTYKSSSDKDKKDKKNTNRYEMNVNGITVNLFNNSQEAINLDSNPNDVSRVFLSGSQGRTAEFKLFTETELAEIRKKDVLITDASLFLYVDESVTYNKEPERIFIYNAKTGAILADYLHDPTASLPSSNDAQTVHLGKLQKKNGKGVYYQLRITNHILNIIKNKAENVPLGIAVASNVKNSFSAKYLNSSNENKFIPMNSLSTPLSTVIYGNSSSIDKDKRLQLKINYTKLK
ncbi:hypothetical protein CGC48_10830 [Capnocytophaga cynodegmi]|uniref:DUF4270 domain-containing protein n=1 Tax=Capnocytophaga cynodegmi TaxID=28189 RepID=A0A250EBH7_9FLAO|nr:DUF4270 domain-containing protein [Capnocytophaga cynodegmi]ATA69066.1 hypothetical protein CGC48_10830 [Capnocytophaga cynodegmi]